MLSMVSQAPIHAVGGSSSNPPDLTVVFARCGEPGVQALRDLGMQNIRYVIYQKEPCRNASARAAHLISQVPSQNVRLMDHNAGDECSAYLQYIHDEYERLPAAVMFLQFGSEHQLVLPSVARTARLVLASLHRMGYMALSRHSFEGLWPAPCEVAGKQGTFLTCSHAIWRDMGAIPTPSAFRFYANGLFAVTRERIRRHSREWYADAVQRASGRARARCDGPDTRRRPGAATRLVGDCHVLEKAWHVMFGEPPTLPPPHLYDVQRAPNTTLRVGGRFYETVPRGKCTAGTPPEGRGVP